MARFTRDPDSRITWNRMAERWRQCASKIERESKAAAKTHVSDVVSLCYRYLSVVGPDAVVAMRGSASCSALGGQEPIHFLHVRQPCR
jgi:hypothetical protein